MNWYISLALLCFVVFSTQIISCTEQVTTPWENAQIADNFIVSFLRVISRSSAFSTSQLQDMTTIRKTLTEAMETFNNSNMSSKTKTQTLNMVFASALADIIAIEYGGVSIETKTNEIENALSLSFQETMGLNNPQFVGDVKNLIFTLALTKATASSTESVVKVGDYKQGQLGTSVSAKATSASSSALQGSSGLEQQGPSTVGPPIVSVSTGGYRPPMVSVSKPLGQQVQIPTEQYAMVSKQPPLGIKKSQGILEFGPQKSSIQATSFPDQQGYGIGVSMAVASGGELKPSVQSSGVNELRQESSMGKIAQVSSSQGNSAAVVQGASANVLAIPINYGEGTVPIGLQATSELGGKLISTQEASKVSRQGPVVYEARAQSASTVKGLEAGSGVVNPLREGSSSYIEQEQGTKGVSVAVDTRSEVKHSGNYGWGTSASMSEGVGGFKQPDIRFGSQQNPVAIGHGTESRESRSSSASRAAATAETGRYLPVTGMGRVPHEAEGFQGSTRAGIQYERGKRGQTSSGQMPANQGLYGTRYQAIGQSGGQDLRSYKLEADANAADAAGVSGGQASSRQGLSEVEEQGLDSARVSEIESRPLTYGLNNYGQGSAAAAAEADATDYKSINSVQGQQGISINKPALVGGNSYASGSAAEIAGSVSGNGPVFIPEGSSRVSSTGSSLGSSNLQETSALSNAVSSIVSKVGTANPGMSDCNVLIQTMLEIIADLVHLLGYCT